MQLLRLKNLNLALVNGDFKGSEYVYVGEGFGSSEIYHSGGGDFRACFSDVSVTGAQGVVEFYEYDPDNADELLGSGIYADGRCLVIDVRHQT